MLDSLVRRPRGWRLGVLLNGAPPQRRSTTRGPLVTFDGRSIQPQPPATTPVADILDSRINDDDRAAIAAACTNDERAWLENLPPLPRRHTTFAFGVQYDVPGVVARLGLSAAMPPPEVHQLASGPLAAGGDYYSADLIMSAFDEAGASIGDLRRVLDFGCSSGRTLRVLAAAYPQITWAGCDPIPGAIQWARDHLPGITWSVSPLRPPLPEADGTLDAAFAWSIWSHFGAAPARAWLDEMHRVIRPGGHLLLTTHGWHTLHTWKARRAWNDADLQAALKGLYSKGFHYRSVFGPEGDGGVPQDDWGQAFMTLEWLADATCPRWSVRLFRAGAVDEVQDLIVLRREPGGP